MLRIFIFSNWKWIVVAQGNGFFGFDCKFQWDMTQFAAFCCHFSVEWLCWRYNLLLLCFLFSVGAFPKDTRCCCFVSYFQLIGCSLKSSPCTRYSRHGFTDTATPSVTISNFAWNPAAVSVALQSLGPIIGFLSLSLSLSLFIVTFYINYTLRCRPLNVIVHWIIVFLQLSTSRDIRCRPLVDYKLISEIKYWSMSFVLSLLTIIVNYWTNENIGCPWNIDNQTL